MVQGRAGTSGVVPLMVRVPEDLRDRIKAAAEASGRSQNSEIVSALLERFPAPVEPLSLDELARWLEYVQSGGPKDEIDSRIWEVNERLEKHQKSMKIIVVVNEANGRIEAEVVLAANHPPPSDC